MSSGLHTKTKKWKKGRRKWLKEKLAEKKALAAERFPALFRYTENGLSITVHAPAYADGIDPQYTAR